MSVRQSFAWWCFAERDLAPDDLLRAAAEIGFSGVELLPEALFALARAYQLEITAMVGHASIERGLNEADAHDRIEREVLAALRTAERWSIPNLICFSGNRTDDGDEVGAEVTARGLARLAPLARQAGVTLLLEVLNSAVDHPGYQADRAAWAVDVVRAVDAPNVKVLLDVYHVHTMGDDVIRVIETNASWIGHYHVAGAPGRGDPDARQNIDYRRVYEAIRSTGYGGFVGHEFIPRGEVRASLSSAWNEAQRHLTTT